MKNPKWTVIDENPNDQKDLNRFVVIPPNTEYDGAVVGEFTDIEPALDWIADELERIITETLNGS